MLQRRLTVPAIALTGAVFVAACGGGAIENAVVRPGITAIEEARSETCGMNEATLRTATEAYTMIEGEAPADEAALVESGFLRDETTDWDVVDGELVAENPACGDPTEVTELDDIVTSSSELPTGEQILALWTAEQIEGVGGLECATELTAILAEAPRFAEEQGVEPAGLTDLVDAGYLTELPELWTVSDADELVPTDDSPCTPLAG